MVVVGGVCLFVVAGDEWGSEREKGRRVKSGQSEAFSVSISILFGHQPA